MILNVMEWGKADAPSILFVHGWSQTHMTWIAQKESELAKKFRLVALDLRGHGMSDAPKEEIAYTNSQIWADDIRAVIEHLDLESPVLVGWSYGGLVITDYLRAYGDDNISGVNLVCAAIKLDDSVPGKMIGSGFLENFAGATSKNLTTNIDAMRNFIEQCFATKLSRQDYERILCWNMTVRPDVRASLVNREVDGTSALASGSCPVLVTQSKRDVIVLPHAAEHILKNVGRAECSWYPESGHGPFLEESERFNRELAEFVSTANF